MSDRKEGKVHGAESRAALGFLDRHAVAVDRPIDGVSGTRRQAEHQSQSEASGCASHSMQSSHGRSARVKLAVVSLAAMVAVSCAGRLPGTGIGGVSTAPSRRRAVEPARPAPGARLTPPPAIVQPSPTPIPTLKPIPTPPAASPPSTPRPLFTRAPITPAPPVTPPPGTPAPLTTPAAPVPAQPTPYGGVSAAPSAQPAVTYMIPLGNWRDADRLEGRPEITEIVDAAARYPNSPIYLAGYVTEADTRQYHADATNLGDELVIHAARELARRGIDANRISGRGMGVNMTMGRAVVVSLDVTPRPPLSNLNPQQLAERAAAEQVPERLPPENRSFKQVAGINAYRVGPGDVLKVTYRMGQPADFAAPVGPLGTISFDIVDDVPVTGLTTLEIESLLKSVLSRYFRKPRLTVSIVAIGSKNVTLITPAGNKLVALGGRTTVFDLIIQQGIPTGAAAPGVADLKAIRVTRGTDTYHVNAFQIVEHNDWKQNLVLDDGDIVYMPTFTEVGDYVTVLGSVVTPGIYPLPGKLTASQLLFQAGGATKNAYLPHARLIRGDGKHPQIIAADIDLVINQGLRSAEKSLQAGDILYVPATRISNWNDFITDIQPTITAITAPLNLYYQVSIVRHLH
jgi:polysaccharide biosynthesis/export protein